MLFFLLRFFIALIFILLRVAFFTLIERKGLAYSQNRLGPNKNILGGLFQPILDALKLLNKKVFIPHQISPGFFYLVPGFFFFLIVQV